MIESDTESESFDSKDESCIKKEIDQDSSFKAESYDIQIKSQNVLEDSKQAIKEELEIPQIIEFMEDTDTDEDDLANNSSTSIKKEEGEVEVNVIDLTSTLKEEEQGQEQDQQQEQIENKWIWKKCPRCLCTFNKRGFNLITQTVQDVSTFRCACCTREYDANRCFSISQRAKLPIERRCKICSQAPIEILRQIQQEAGMNIQQHLKKKKRASQQQQKNMTKRQREAAGEGELLNTNTVHTRSMGMEMDDLARKSMEEKLYKLQLARRSIERRRQSNDLRGSTRVEYLVQLQEEEIQLNLKEQAYQRQAPVLYAELKRQMKIRPPRTIPKNERDSPKRNKKRRKTQRSTSTISPHI